MRRRSSNESTADLYLRLGLSYDELESGFVNAERTIRDNMTRLSRENTIIELQAQVEIAGLDSTADAQRILDIQTQALNRQLEHQRDRVRLATAELRNMTDRTGETSDQTQRAQLALERERLALVQLEQRLNTLNDTQEESNENTGDFLERLRELAGKFAPVVAGISAVVGALTAAGSASKELIEDWRELQTQAYELNMTVNDTENFLRHMKLAGGDIGDFEGYIRGITDAYVKGEWDDPEFIALRKYGASVIDATGRLKTFEELTEEVYQAWKKADAAGEGIEFLQLTGGESGIRDAIQFFKRYEEAKEDAEKIFDAGLDPEEFHKAERALNLLTMQMDEFKDALVNVITPASVNFFNELFKTFHDGTEFLSDNKEEFQRWGFIAAEAIKSVLNPLGSLIDTFQDMKNAAPTLNLEVDDADFKKVLQLISDTSNKLSDTPLEHFKNTLAGLFNNTELVKNAEKAQQEYSAAIEETTKSMADFRREDEAATKAMQSKDADKLNPLNQYSFQRTTDYVDELEDLRAEIDNFNKDYNLSLSQLELWRSRAYRQNYISDDERIAIEKLYSAKLEQIEQERAHTLKEIREDVNAELGNELEQRLLDIEREKREWISAGMEMAEATELSQKLIADAYDEQSKRLDEIREKVLSLNRTDLENKIIEIDRQRDDWVDIGMEETEAENLAQQLKTKAVSEAEKNLDNLMEERQRLYEEYRRNVEETAFAVQSVWDNEMNNELRRIEQERKAWIQKGVDEVSATRWAEQQKVDIQRNAAMEVLKSQLKEYRAFQKGGYEGLRQYQLRQLYRTGIRPEDLQMTPQQLSDFKFAQKAVENSLLPNFMSEEDISRKYYARTKQYSNYDLPNVEVEMMPEMTNQLESLNNQIVELSKTINNAKWSTMQPQISVTVQIEEAHAWDYPHIQELADKVADKIAPEIVSALGGDTNSY